jgi:hypothetical protein
MKNITAKDIDELRKITGKSFLECKKILLDNQGDIENYLKLNSASQKTILDTCPHCKSPNAKRSNDCDWCGNQIL